MSLQNIAQHLAQQGRGNDSMLVHMSPQEVQSLHKLAQAKGMPGLPKNPNTGLPEANWLDKALPALIGAGVSYLTDGAVSPTMIGLGTGAASALATGSIQQGLMAGLGAYGGAGLEAGLAGAGAANMGTDALTAAQGSAADLVSQGVITPDMTDAYVQQQVGDQMANATPFERLSAGVSGLGSEAGRSTALGALGGGWGATKTALAAAAPMMTMSQPTVSMPGISTQPTQFVQTKMVDPYTKRLYDVSKVPASQFTGTFQDQINNYLANNPNPIPVQDRLAKEGGMMGYADGGAVEHFDDGGAAALLNQANRLPNGVGGNAGSVINPNGTITEPAVAANLPAPQNAGVGYTSPTVSSLDEFNAKYNTLSGGTKQAYDYLMGNGPYPYAPYTSTGQVMAPYNTSVINGPGTTGGGGPGIVNKPVVNPPVVTPPVVKPGGSTGGGSTGGGGSTNKGVIGNALSGMGGDLGYLAGISGLTYALTGTPFGGLLSSALQTGQEAPVVDLSTYGADGASSAANAMDQYTAGPYGGPTDVGAGAGADTATAAANTAASQEGALSQSQLDAIANGDISGGAAAGTDASTIAAKNVATGADTAAGTDAATAAANTAASQEGALSQSQLDAIANGDISGGAAATDLGSAAATDLGSAAASDAASAAAADAAASDAAAAGGTDLLGSIGDFLGSSDTLSAIASFFGFKDGGAIANAYAPGGLAALAHGGHVKHYAGDAGSLVNNASEAYENSNLNEAGAYKNDPLEAFYKTVPSSVMRTPAGAGLAAALYSPALNIGDQQQMDAIRQQMHSPTSQYVNGRMRHTMSNMAHGGMADGGYNLGGYSDGGRLLRGPGDGVSDDIPATIGHKQPARLADGEFVVPARIVSELGNGSTEAGARRLYAMMDRIQKARGKTVGKNKVATDTKASKYLPA